MARATTERFDGAILPPGTIAFVRRRLTEAGGLALIATAAILTAAVVTYSQSDPSWNHAVAANPTNAAGTLGAFVADVAVQMVGGAVAVPLIALFVWGWLIARGRRPSRLRWRAVAVLIALPAIAAALAAFPEPATWPTLTGLGGAVGDMLSAAVAAELSQLGVPFAVAITVLLGGAGGAAAGSYGLGIRWADWKALAGRLARFACAVRRAVAKAQATLARLPTPSVAGRVEPTIAAKPRQRAPADARQPLDVARHESPGATVVTPPGPTIRPGRKSDAARQPAFDFDHQEGYRPPPLDLLEAPPEIGRTDAISRDVLEAKARQLATVLEDFGVRGEIVRVRPGPVITLYELVPAPGTKTSRVISLADDIARSMSAVSVRVAVVPGRNVIGIELPNEKRETVALRELLGSEAFERAPGKLVLALGKDIGGAPVVVDLARMPHLLIAGTTGSGKSVAINTMIVSLLYQMPPSVCRLILIDPKMLELSVYDGVPHLLAPVVTDPSKAVVALKWTVREMEQRYRAMSQLGVRNIAGFNARLAEAAKRGERLTRRVQTGFDEEGRPTFEDQPLDLAPLPFIVVVVDEMADLMLVAGKDIEATVQRLAQMARAAGIHLIMATQRPSVDVITGTIKANFPTRISFQVTSKIDSRTILGEQGAEQLLGQGDMLYMAAGGRVTRVHGPFISDRDVEGVARHLLTLGEPNYVTEVTEEEEDDPASLLDGLGGEGGDDLYQQAVALVAREGKASTSFVQRHLQIGYNRAARIIERMEKDGIVSRADRVGRREVLVADHGS